MALKIDDGRSARVGEPPPPHSHAAPGRARPRESQDDDCETEKPKKEEENTTKTLAGLMLRSVLLAPFDGIVCGFPFPCAATLNTATAPTENYHPTDRLPG